MEGFSLGCFRVSNMAHVLPSSVFTTVAEGPTDRFVLMADPEESGPEGAVATAVLVEEDEALNLVDMDTAFRCRRILEPTKVDIRLNIVCSSANAAVFPT